jgi:hypothetical protein
MAPQFDKSLRDLLRAAGCLLVRQGKGNHEIWHSPLTKRNFPVPVGIPSRPPPTPFYVRRDCRRHSEPGVDANKNGRVFRPGRFKI